MAVIPGRLKRAANRCIDNINNSQLYINNNNNHNIK